MDDGLVKRSKGQGGEGGREEEEEEQGGGAVRLRAYTRSASVRGGARFRVELARPTLHVASGLALPEVALQARIAHLPAEPPQLLGSTRLLGSARASGARPSAPSCSVPYLGAF